MKRSKQQDIMRLMGSREEMSRQPTRHPLERLMDSVDPYEDVREETEMDVWETNAPVEVVPILDSDGNVEGYEERVTQTARTPKGDEEHALNGKTVTTELISKNDE